MYTARITRRNKAAILLLLDRSGSMAEEVLYEGHTITKAEALCEVVNSLLEEIINRCHRERFIGDYFDVAVVGYSGEGVAPLFGSGFRRIVDIDVMDVPSRTHYIKRTLPDGRRFDSFISRRQWVTPHAKGRTPMGEALRVATRMCRSWANKHQDSLPPIVINITDGEATDATADELQLRAEKLREISTQDGNLLLMNIHLASQYDTPTDSIKFPDEQTPLPIGRLSRLLYNMSSPLPEPYNEAVMEIRGGTPPFRGFCYNASIEELLSLLTIGSLCVNQLI